jgi:Domain of unknown function (DUF4389)
MSTGEDRPADGMPPAGTGSGPSQLPNDPAPSDSAPNDPAPNDSAPNDSGPNPSGPDGPATGTQAPGPLPSAPPVIVPPPANIWPAAPVQQRGSGTYTVDVGVDVPERIARWRPLVQWILALPLYILLYVLRIVAGICAFIGWFVALFTGQLPEGLGNLIAGYYRLYWRTTTYALFLREKYPSFALSMGYSDPGDDPAWFEVQRPVKLSRLAVLFRIILVIPQLIALFFVVIALYFVSIVAFFVVIIAGRWPSGLAEFVIGANRWLLRVDAWFDLLADSYPPFSLT